MKKYYYFLFILLAFPFSACEKEEDGNREDLYLQPLDVIQKNIMGKWKLQTEVHGQSVSYPTDWYIEFFEDYFITCIYGYFQKISFEWRYLPIPEERGNEKTYIMWEKEHDSGIWYFHDITNDTLNVLGLGSAIYSFTRTSDIYTCEEKEPEIVDTSWTSLLQAPPSVIQDTIQGKWNWYATHILGGDNDTYYPKDTHVEFFEDYYTVSNADGIFEKVSFVWKDVQLRYYFRPSDDNGRSYVVWNKETDEGIWYFRGIRNDTLEVNSYRNHYNSPYQANIHEFVRVR
jgi:hypothetical protein